MRLLCEKIKNRLCPTEEDSACLCYSNCMCWREGGGKEGQWALGEGSKSGALDSEQKASKGGGS